MKGDFSRDTFNAFKHFSRLLMQQGRVQLDADWNEQASISAHYLRTLAADLIGPHGGPRDGFKISRIPADTGQPLMDLAIAGGHYYVAGLLCEHLAAVGNQGAAATYWTQRDYPVGKDAGALPQAPFLVYLDVWERHITVVEDPGILEPALGGADTCTRVQVVWQVKAMPLSPPTTDATGKRLTRLWRESAEEALRLAVPCKATMRARAYSGTGSGGSGTTSGEGAAYRGIENRLYRVEIHDGGDSAPSFKWSRANGSVVFPIAKIFDTAVQVGRPDDLELKLRCGDWVEVADDDAVLLWRTAPLLQVQAIDPSTGMVTLSGKPSVDESSPASKHPLLRRWEGWQPVRKTSDTGSMDWQELEDGVQVQFGAAGAFSTGDYWLIPARVATGDVIWPNDNGTPSPTALPPAGVEHHFAPLSVLLPQQSGGVLPLDLRRVFKPLV